MLLLFFPQTKNEFEKQQNKMERDPKENVTTASNKAQVGIFYLHKGYFDQCIYPCLQYLICYHLLHLCLIFLLLRLITSVIPLSPAQKNISHPSCRSTVAFTLALSRRPLVGLWAAFRMASHQRNSSRKASW